MWRTTRREQERWAMLLHVSQDDADDGYDDADDGYETADDGYDAADDGYDGDYGACMVNDLKRK